MSKISVIIPVYNVENFIAEAIQSCLKQSLQDIEIIIVDDCGTDKSMAIVKEFANQILSPPSFKVFVKASYGLIIYFIATHIATPDTPNQFFLVKDTSSRFLRFCK